MKTVYRLAIAKMTLIALSSILQILGFAFLIKDKDLLSGICLGGAALVIPALIFISPNLKQAFKAYLISIISFPMIYVVLVFGLLILSSIVDQKWDITLERIRLMIYTTIPIFFVALAATLPVFAGSAIAKTGYQKYKHKIK